MHGWTTARILLLRAGRRGSVTAEFAVVLPAVTALLALLLLAAAAGTLQLRLEEGARAGARALARGQSAAQAADIATRLAGDGVAISVDLASGYATVTLSGKAAGPLAWAVPWRQSAQATAVVENYGTSGAVGQGGGLHATANCVGSGPEDCPRGVQAEIAGSWRDASSQVATRPPDPEDRALRPLRPLRVLREHGLPGEMEQVHAEAPHQGQEQPQAGRAYALPGAQDQEQALPRKGSCKSALWRWVNVPKPGMATIVRPAPGPVGREFHGPA